MWRRLPGLAALFALHGLAREVDRAVGILLHTSLDLPRFVPEALGLLEAGRVAARAAAWTAGGLAVAIALAGARARRDGSSLAEALDEERRSFAPLLLRPVLTVLTLVSLAVLPTWPYGFTLPVALTQDWGPAQDLAVLAALLVSHGRAVSWPAPRPASFAFLAFLVYALVTPRWARHWDGHPGNEPKTLRMGVALGHWLSLDVEPVSGPMETLPTRPLPASAAAAARAFGGHSLDMLGALAQGSGAVGLRAIRATPMTRQTLRGKDGGVYYVLAPGPSLLVAPLLRIDRALNQRRGTAGRLTVTLLAWNALAAGVATATFVLLRAHLGRAGLAALVAGVAALLPPMLLYAYQLYPELLAAGVMALAFRSLLRAGWWTTPSCLALGLWLALLPWLHQKFLPLWAALTLAALVRAVDDLVPARGLLALALPQAVSLYLTALYNFAITGSVRPDAVFQAWGFGVSTSRIELGLFGLPFDGRYGLFPYAPAFLLAAGGLWAIRRGRAYLPWALAAAAAYFLTVASADNWAGPVSNLGRFLLPLVPVFALLAGRALVPAAARAGVRFLCLTLAGWSALVAVMLWRDPHAANDCALLLARSAFADGTTYIPDLYVSSWGEAPPGTQARVAAWLGLCAMLAGWLRRAGRGMVGESAPQTLAGTTVVLLLAGLALEQLPIRPRGVRFGRALDLGQGTTAYVSGEAEVAADHVRAGEGRLDVLVRSRAPLDALEVQAQGPGLLRVSDAPPVLLPRHAVTLAVPLETVRELTGRRGTRETLYRQSLELRRAEDGVVVRLRARLSRSGDNGPRP
jgi:hypothetical protein